MKTTKLEAGKFYVVRTSDSRVFAKGYTREDWAIANARHKSACSGAAHHVAKAVSK